jgi:bifunctional NMN adenylyltransferase/nudix hydrolase
MSLGINSHINSGINSGSDCYSVIIGRFQPLHKGHGYLIKQALKNSDYLIIVVGSSFSSRTLRNSFTFDERKEIILDALSDPDFAEISNIKNRVFIVAVRDYLYDSGDIAWQEAILAEIDKILKNKNKNKNILLTGYEKDQTSYYLKYFIDIHKWNYLGCDYYNNINSTEIRLSYLSGNKNKNKNKNIYKSTLDWLDKFKETNEFASLHNEYKAMIAYRKLWENSPFPPIFVTCDALVLHNNKILLIKRKDYPGKGLLALPGGFLDEPEKIIDGIIRELYEETKLDLPKDSLLKSLISVKPFDDPKRSSRGRIITHTGLFKLRDNIPTPKVVGSDDAIDAIWVDIDDFLLKPEDIFSDHYQIVTYFLREYFNYQDN